MKIYCSFHDRIHNCSEAKFEKIANGEIECKCCGRFASGNSLHGFELPESFLINGIPYNTGEQTYCNCFITGFPGNYSKEEITKHNGDRTIEEIEKAEIEEREEEMLEEFQEKSLALP